MTRMPSERLVPGVKKRMPPPPCLAASSSQPSARAAAMTSSLGAPCTDCGSVRSSSTGLPFMSTRTVPSRVASSAGLGGLAVSVAAGPTNGAAGTCPAMRSNSAAAAAAAVRASPAAMSAAFCSRCARASSSLVSGGLPPEETADACSDIEVRTASSQAVMCCE
jgi:cytochrome c1